MSYPAGSMMSRARLIFLLLAGWGVLVAGMTALVQRVDDTERLFSLALSGRGDLAGLVVENPLRARSLVEELWNRGLSRRSRSAEGHEAEEEFQRAKRLSEVIERDLQDPSLVRFTEWYRRRGPAGMCPEVRGKRTAPSTPSSGYQIRRQPPRVREPRSDLGSRRCAVVESGQRR